MSALTKLLKSCTNKANLYKISKAQCRQQSFTSSKLFYTKYGDPSQVIEKVDEEISDDIKPHEVLVKMLAAPVNPADINTIQGKYPSRPPLPAVAGNEGVAEVLKSGGDVEDIDVGDHVVPISWCLGTWRTHAVFQQKQIFKVPKELGLVEAATLTVNPCTAYRMIRDFVLLKPGDSLIQNGANSAVGQNVIQICRVWGIKTVNVVRDRENLQQLKDYLTDLGATCVLTEEELKKTDLFKTGKVPKPRLALNCVGGKSALAVMRNLEAGCPMVTYGGMSMQPVTVPTSALIFKNVRAVGFWITQWSKQHAHSEDRDEMFEDLIAMMIANELCAPSSKMIGLDDYKEALQNTISAKGMTGKKYILEF